LNVDVFELFLDALLACLLRLIAKIMCGRYVTEYTWSEIHAFSQAIGIETPAQNPEPAYNIAPTQSSFMLLPHGPRLALAQRLRFGLTPYWATGEKHLSRHSTRG
jgi:putative SOS response-associated peptidase YedK